MNNTDIKDRSKSSDRNLLWLPATFMAVGMLIFLGISFAKYHKRFLRKKQLSTEYLEVNLALKRPRIGGPLCSTYSMPMHDLAASLSLPLNFPFYEVVQAQMPNGALHSVRGSTPVTRHPHIKDTHKCISERTQNQFQPPTVQSPHHGFTGYHNSAFDASPEDVEVRFSDLCGGCQERLKATNGLGETQSHPTSNKNKYPVYSDTDDFGANFVGSEYEQGCEHLVEDAFHRPRRASDAVKMDVFNKHKKKSRDPFTRGHQPWTFGQRQPSQQNEDRKGNVFWLDMHSYQHTLV